MSTADITVTVKSKLTEIENDWMSDLKVGDIVNLANGENGRLARICGKHETRHFPGIEIERSFDLMWL